MLFDNLRSLLFSGRRLRWVDMEPSLLEPRSMPTDLGLNGCGANILSGARARFICWYVKAVRRHGTLVTSQAHAEIACNIQVWNAAVRQASTRKDQGVLSIAHRLMWQLAIQEEPMPGSVSPAAKACRRFSTRAVLREERRPEMFPTNQNDRTKLRGYCCFPMHTAQRCVSPFQRNLSIQHECADRPRTGRPFSPDDAPCRKR